MTAIREAVLLVTLASGLAACGPGVGNVQFTTSGDGLTIIPDSATKPGFVDGWSVEIKRLLVIVKEVTIADQAGKVVYKQPNGLLFDLARPGPFTVDQATGLSAQKYDKVSYAIAPDPQFQIVNMGAASQPDANLMRNNAFGLYLEGTATKGSASKSFQWGFTLDTLYSNCANSEAGGTGVTVSAGKTETVELSVHAEHLFLDSLTDESSKLRFDDLANADKTPADGTISLDELANVSLSSLSTSYGTGGNASVKSLKDYLLMATRTLGHYRGDGECTMQAR